jgi:hypothetical protein
MVESRREARHRVLKAGTIEFNGGAIDCKIRNLSATGAALEVVSQTGVPEKFTLVHSGGGGAFALLYRVAEGLPDRHRVRLDRSGRRVDEGAVAPCPPFLCCVEMVGTLALCPRYDFPFQFQFLVLSTSAPFLIHGIMSRSFAPTSSIG